VKTVENSAENSRKSKSKTSSEVKTRYNRKTYKTYTFSVRMDSELYKVIEEFKQDLQDIIRINDYICFEGRL